MPSFKMLKQAPHFHETWHDTIPLQATRAPFFKFVTTCNDNIAAYERTRDAGDTSTEGKSRVVPGHAVKAMGGVNVSLHSFLTSALDGGECTP